jgi:hypothetical protein
LPSKPGNDASGVGWKGNAEVAMSRKNPVPLPDRVASAAEKALAANHFVSAIDILVGIGRRDAGEAVTLVPRSNRLPGGSSSDRSAMHLGGDAALAVMGDRERIACKPC